MVVSSMVTSISSISETSPISLSMDIVSAPSISHVKVTVSSGPTVFSEASKEMISTLGDEDQESLKEKDKLATKLNELEQMLYNT